VRIYSIKHRKNYQKNTKKQNPGIVPALTSFDSADRQFTMIDDRRVCDCSKQKLTYINTCSTAATQPPLAHRRDPGVLGIMLAEPHE
jgi:hypothetical protein